MLLSETLLPEFDQEIASTRKCLERIPDEKLGWKPHEKSMTMARLAGHLAEIPMWGRETMTKTEIDIMPVGAPPYEPWKPATVAEILERFDRQASEARAAIASSTDADFMVPWSLLSGGNMVFTMPRAAVLRGMVLNHLVHHRGQLSVYLRLNDIPVPSIYGPSADEGSMGG